MASSMANLCGGGATEVVAHSLSSLNQRHYVFVEA